MRSIPKEQYTALRQTACHPDQVPFLPLARVEQFLNRGLKTHLRGWRQKPHTQAVFCSAHCSLFQGVEPAVVSEWCQDQSGKVATHTLWPPVHVVKPFHLSKG